MIKWLDTYIIIGMLIAGVILSMVVVSALGVNIPQPIVVPNDTTTSANNTQFWQGYTPQTYASSSLLNNTFWSIIGNQAGLSGTKFGSYALNTTGNITTATLNTGFGFNELYPMNQPVRTTDNPTFSALNLSVGANNYNYLTNIMFSEFGSRQLVGGVRAYFSLSSWDGDATDSVFFKAYSRSIFQTNSEGIQFGYNAETGYNEISSFYQGLSGAIRNITLFTQGNPNQTTWRTDGSVYFGQGGAVQINPDTFTALDVPIKDVYFRGTTNYQTLVGLGGDQIFGEFASLGDIQTNNLLIINNSQHNTNVPANFGDNKEAQCYYNSTDFICNPKNVGTGKFFIDGSMVINESLKVNQNADIIGNVNITGNFSAKRPYWSGYDNSTQPFLNTANAQVINISNNRDYDAWLINVTGKQNLTFKQTGDYLCVLSPEFFQNSGGTALITFWMQKNGVDVPWSNSRFSVANNAYNAPSITFQFDITNPATDNIRFMWWSDNTGSQIYSSGVLTSPTRPSIPGILVNCQKLSEITP